MAEQCRERRLEVTESDGITHLRSLPDASIGAVTGFHIVEHLSFELLIQLLDETVRVLKPGGLAIFETPNPHNLLVGSANFYTDPTHRNPLPSPTLKFLAEARGLCRIEVINLHPFPEAFHVVGSEVAERFNEYFYGAQDYAVMGWKV
jgi:O-antigen chain-terminating methyltransferase